MSERTERGGTVLSASQAVRLIKMGAPLHPILVHFTIALTAASFFFDAVGFLFDIPSLAYTGWWTLAGSVVMTVFTIATGITSRIRLPMEEGEARSFLRAHMALGPVFFGLLVAVAIWRARAWEAERAVTWWYLAAMGFVALVMTAQGYLGGELVYRYGAEVERAYRKLPESRGKSSAPSLVSSRGAAVSLSTNERGERV